MARVSELMASRLVTARPVESVAEVAARMAEAEIGAVLVITDGELTGIFSERDLVRRVVGPGRSPAEVEVGEVATGNVVTVASDASARQCAELLREHGIRHLPVVDMGVPVGIISARDFFAFVARRLEHMIDERLYEQKLDEGFDPYDHLGGSYGE